MVIKRLLTTRQTAEFLNTTTGELANLRHHGRGPTYIKISRKILYDMEDLELWLERHKVETIDSLEESRR
jgi:hypothetical protein